MVVQMIKELILLPLRYAFLAGLLFYYWLVGIWRSLMTPFEPIVAKSRKFTDDDISVGGIIRTLTKAYFLALLLCYHYIKMVADIFLVPISNWLEALRKALGIPDKVTIEPQPRDKKV